MATVLPIGTKPAKGFRQGLKASPLDNLKRLMRLQTKRSNCTGSGGVTVGDRNEMNAHP
jgi:hypothetical protein